MKTILWRRRRVLLQLGVFAALLLLSRSASAGWTIYPWSACYTEPSDTQLTIHSSTAGPINTDSTYYVTMRCPVVTGNSTASWYDATDVVKIDAYVADGHTSAGVQAQLFVQDPENRYNWDSTLTKYTGGSFAGEDTLSVSNDFEGDSDYLGWSMWLRISLPAQDGTWTSTLNQYWVEA
jgi:hypothetical protein